jgi:dihydroorotase
VKYDLLLKGGHVLDPGHGLDAPLDIGIKDGRIAAIAPDIAASDAGRVVEMHGPNRRVVPGLIDLHTHVARGATTPGVGLDCCEPDVVGVRAGVTTVVDTGSVGVTNIGIFDAHIRPASKTRIICYLNVGSFALTTPRRADVLSLDEVDLDAITHCVEANPGLVSGIKLRVTGPFVIEQGEALIGLSKSVAREIGVPFMVHIGNRLATPQRGLELTRSVLNVLEPGDSITHLCTPHPGGVLDESDLPLAELKTARDNGVWLDAALGRHNFGIDVARKQMELGIVPDTISTDITPGGYGEIVFSLLECMAKFLSLGYSLADVVRMTTSAPASALGLPDQLGALAVGREADISVIDIVSGRFQFVDTVGQTFTGQQALVPVLTVRAGEVIVPEWGPHPWGWEPPV